MSKYRIKQDAIETWRNKGGGSNDKEKLFNDSRNLIINFQELLNDVNSLTENRFGFYVCIFKYIKIPAKGWRINFGEDPINITDVKQKGVYTYVENNSHYTNLFYKLNRTNINWLIEKIE